MINSWNKVKKGNRIRRSWCCSGAGRRTA